MLIFTASFFLAKNQLSCLLRGIGLKIPKAERFPNTFYVSETSSQVFTRPTGLDFVKLTSRSDKTKSINTHVLTTLKDPQ
jgi:hypothetical protein